MAQVDEHPSLDWGSCHLRIREFKPCIGRHADGTNPAYDSLSLFLSLVSVSLCLSAHPPHQINKPKNKLIN